jgi:threonine synthase
MNINANLTIERPTFVTHLECSWTGEIYEADRPHNLSHAGKPLLVRYNLDGVRASFSKEALAARPNDLWRWRELLPVRRVADIVSLGEVATPLIPLMRSVQDLGGREVLVKDEGRLPGTVALTLAV